MTDVSSQDWLLSLVVASDEPMKPVHVQKGLFLLSMEGPERALGAYTFRPYEGDLSREPSMRILTTLSRNG